MLKHWSVISNDAAANNDEVEVTLHNVSKVIFEQYLPVYYACIPVELISAALTSIGFVSIVADEKLRCRKAFILFTCLFFGYFCMAFGSLLSIIIQLVNFDFVGHAVMTRRSCLGSTFCYSFGFQIVADTGFVMAIDRSLAIVSPVWYSKRYKGWMLYCQLLLMIFKYGIFIVLKAITATDELIPICTMASGSFGAVQMVQTYMTAFALGSTLLIYAILIGWVKQKLFVVKENAHFYSQRQRRLKSRLLFTLVVCVVIHITTVCVGIVVGWIAMGHSDPKKTMAITKYGLVTELSGPLNAIFLYIRTNEIRVSIYNLCTKVGKSFGIHLRTKIMPISTQTFIAKYAGNSAESHA